MQPKTQSDKTTAAGSDPVRASAVFCIIFQAREKNQLRFSGVSVEM